jgi:hypothetical protein
MISVWNYSQTSQDATLTLYYFGGQYRIPIHLDARKSYNLDVMELVKSQVPDADGNLIPSNIKSGSAMLVGPSGSELERMNVVVSASTYNVRNATCLPICINCGGLTSLYLSPSTINIVLNGSAPASAVYTTSSAGPYPASGATWSTENTAIATVNNGQVNGLAVGSTSISATMSATSGQYQCYESSPCADQLFSGSGTINVTPPPPDISSISPSIIPVGFGTTIKIVGSGFGTSPVVNLPSGVTASGQSGTDGVINLTLSVPTNTVIGYDYITVTANGQTSTPPYLVVLDGPYQIVVVSDNTYPAGTGMGICPAGGSVCRWVVYQIMNFSGITAAQTDLCETPSFTWTCTGLNPPGTSFNACTSANYSKSNGQFTDTWSLGPTAYPSGCGYNITDTWNWGSTSTPTPLGVLTGYAYSNAIQINGVTSPAKMPAGTVIPF